MSDTVARARELLEAAGAFEGITASFLLCSTPHLAEDEAALLAAAPALLAELADEVGVERSLRVQMARELLVLTRAAGVPDPNMEDFGGIGSRVLRALTPMDDAMVDLMGGEG